MDKWNEKKSQTYNPQSTKKLFKRAYMFIASIMEIKHQFYHEHGIRWESTFWKISMLFSLYCKLTDVLRNDTVSQYIIDQEFPLSVV